MSARLAPELGYEFGDAVCAERFFSADNRRIIARFEKREQPIIGTPIESCNTNLFFGFFFDGTRNNYLQAESGRNHSNVARLYDCYPGFGVPGVLPKTTEWEDKRNTRNTHFFKVYVPGVSSPFTEVGDRGEGAQRQAGAASGAFGERRIIWALVQAINNIHRYFFQSSLILQPELDRLLRQIVLNKHARHLMDNRAAHGSPFIVREAEMRARREFRRLLARLHTAISKHQPDKKSGKPAKVNPAVVKKIYVSAFGFSRGATQARAFVNWFHSLCKLDAELSGITEGMSLGGFKVEFDFLGVFDTVASVGAGNTIGFFDGHGAWADTEDSLRVPAGVKCLHLVAAHELRRSFPVDSISVRGVLPDGCQEVVVPGVHSDVGCGYSPCEQGRGTDPNGDDMISRVPLLMMYKAARLSGVPLKLENATPVAKTRFAIKAETIGAFNAYIATCKEREGPIHRIMREQARKQIEWRLLRRLNGRNPLDSTASFLRATTFEQNDLYSAACEFEEEILEFLAWRTEKRPEFKPANQQAGFKNEHLSEWEEIATWWEQGPQPSTAVMSFFDLYVHDSRAWFKLIPGNPDNETDQRTKLAEWAKEHVAGKTHNDTIDDRPKHLAAQEYVKTGKIPRMLNSGREPFRSSRESWGLSGKAGYLRFRKIYGGFDSALISSVSSPDISTELAAFDEYGKRTAATS